MATDTKHVVIDIKDDVEEVETDTEEPYDREFLHRVIEDAGRWAFGVKLVELWVLNESGTHLYQPQRGWWIDHYAEGKDNKFAVLADPSHPDFIPAAPLAPGIGLPGYLWSQTKRGNMVDRRRSRLSIVRAESKRGSIYGAKNTRGSLIGADDPKSESIGISTTKGFGSTRNRAQLLSAPMSWCEVKPLAADPDQPRNDRLQYLANAGLGLAAGVPFNIGGTQGIVIYMARENADLSELTDSINEEYLQRATFVIGSTYSLRKPRLAVVSRKKATRSEGWRRLRQRLAAIKAMGKTLKDVIQEESEKEKEVHHIPHTVGEFIHEVDGTFQTIAAFFFGKFKLEKTKFFGANVKAPPGFGWKASIFTFLGAFITLSILTNLNKALVEEYGSGYSIVLPPFGALMTLQYGLTAAPASQPRNALIGQTLALTIACLIGRIPELELWLRQSLATALAIGVMVKFGVTHPPAGAAALVFSSGKQSWRQMGLMLLGNAIAVLTSTLINNWNDKRQYPTFWGFRPITRMFGSKSKAT